MGVIVFFKIVPVVLTSIYVKTTGKAFVSEHTPIKNCSKRQFQTITPIESCCYNHSKIKNTVVTTVFYVTEMNSSPQRDFFLQCILPICIHCIVIARVPCTLDSLHNCYSNVIQINQHVKSFKMRCHITFPVFSGFMGEPDPENRIYGYRWNPQVKPDPWVPLPRL